MTLAGARASPPPASRTCSGSFAPGRHVQLGARGADAADQPDQPVDLRPRLRIERPRVRHRPFRHDQRIGPRAIAFHNSSVMNGMNGWSMTRIWSSTQPATAFGLLVDLALDQLQIPVAEGRPDEMVDGCWRSRRSGARPGEVERLDRLHRLADDPAVDRQARLAAARCPALAPMPLAWQKRAAFHSLVAKLR